MAPLVSVCHTSQWYHMYTIGIYSKVRQDCEQLKTAAKKALSPP